MADTAKQAEVKTNYPVVSGIGASNKHKGRQINLIPLKGSLVPRRLKKGMMD